eukprot:2619799-Rhodomonas_salina.2
MKAGRMIALAKGSEVCSAIVLRALCNLWYWPRVCCYATSPCACGATSGTDRAWAATVSAYASATRCPRVTHTGYGASTPATSLQTLQLRSRCFTSELPLETPRRADLTRDVLALS